MAGTSANWPVYVAVGINLDRERDVLGLWVGTGAEGAKHWLTMLTELTNWGVADVCVVCCDGLSGLPEAIKATWPLTTVRPLLAGVPVGRCNRPDRRPKRQYAT
ncbi:hypothetical protein C3Y87_21255 [Carbonactinospora thermoautotrophica]|uniref:transposase n=1 Tax=Carbonactinospora thermoautotrophica TaxID=1469144 RepID=UPI0022712B28|nr:transposase [Carbonactinospora thermoautotrophica]MCX9193858.1 hypothetical protein [Carbonactinospora thermoautotrophica]